LEKPVGSMGSFHVTFGVGDEGFGFRIRMEVKCREGKVPTNLETLVELLKDVVAFSLSWCRILVVWACLGDTYVRRSLQCVGGGLPASRCGGSPSDRVGRRSRSSRDQGSCDRR
jgi:hypothetical protein